MLVQVQAWRNAELASPGMTWRLVPFFCLAILVLCYPCVWGSGKIAGCCSDETCCQILSAQGVLITLTLFTKSAVFLRIPWYRNNYQMTKISATDVRFKVENHEYWLVQRSKEENTLPDFVIFAVVIRLLQIPFLLEQTSYCTSI